MDLDDLVAGEPLRLLLQALGQMDMTATEDGGATVEAQFDPVVGAALHRALDRVAEEIPAAPAGGADDDGQRAEAFTVLVQRVVEAAER
jgi:hypothetical protein